MGLLLAVPTVVCIWRAAYQVIAQNQPPLPNRHCLQFRCQSQCLRKVSQHDQPGMSVVASMASPTTRPPIN